MEQVPEADGPGLDVLERPFVAFAPQSDVQRRLHAGLKEAVRQRREALAAQDTIRAMNGANSTWFCGAWMKNGFHEDGVKSALDVCARFGVQL